MTAEQLTRALTLTPSIVSVQNRFNLLDRESAAVLKVCEAHGLAFLPWFPLANGALTVDAAATLDTVAGRLGASRGQTALAWLLHHSPALLPTPGTGSLAHLEENLDAAAPGSTRPRSPSWTRSPQTLSTMVDTRVVST